MNLKKISKIITIFVFFAFITSTSFAQEDCEACNGTGKKTLINSCRECGETGWVDHIKVCTKCYGYGKIVDFAGNKLTCPKCDGEGTEPTKAICLCCDGKGEYKTQHNCFVCNGTGKRP